MYAGPHATEANEMLVDLVYIMGKEVFAGLLYTHVYLGQRS